MYFNYLQCFCDYQSIAEMQSMKTWRNTARSDRHKIRSIVSHWLKVLYHHFHWSSDSATRNTFYLQDQKPKNTTRLQAITCVWEGIKCQVQVKIEVLTISIQLEILVPQSGWYLFNIRTLLHFNLLHTCCAALCTMIRNAFVLLKFVF